MADPRQSGKQKHTGVEVYWTNVTYRTVWMLAIALIAILLSGWWLLHRSSFNSVLNKIDETFSGSKTVTTTVTANQVRFVNLEGRVEVRKVGSVEWSVANHQVALDKGDVIRTGSDGLARISFANGATYSVKPDTLITVESNTVGQSAQQTRVAVNIRSGAVDLSTTSSGAEVSFEDATARVNQNSRAAVRSDPESKQHEITVQAGGAEVQRGDRRVQLGTYDRVGFPTGGEITISRILAPPELSSPLNTEPITATADALERFPVEFRWRPVQGAVSYHLRVSTSSMFNQIEAEKRVNAPGAVITGLKPGTHFWVVTAIDAQRGESAASETRQFSLFENTGSDEMFLEIDKPKLHGNVVEITGRTEPGATLLIRGQTVPNIGADGRFQFFTPPLPRGSQEIKIAGQNRRGGTANDVVRIAIP